MVRVFEAVSHVSETGAERGNAVGPGRDLIWILAEKRRRGILLRLRNLSSGQRIIQPHTLDALDKCNTIRYTYNMRANIGETLVEWDENKNRINIRKHGISFETAALVFADEERIEYYDKLHSLDEDRYVVLGCVQGVLYVVYTMRDEAARLISARLATPRERKIYYGE